MGTRYFVGSADAVTLVILRWGIGFLCVLPVAVLLRVKWPARADWPAVATLGVCFFGLFFVLYNTALAYTTAARASLALSTLPVQTMPVGALLGIEPLSLRKSLGVGDRHARCTRWRLPPGCPRRRPAPGGVN